MSEWRPVGGFASIAGEAGIFIDEHGACFMMGRSRYDGEHGIFVAKDGKNMPPDINRGAGRGPNLHRCNPSVME